MFEDECCNTCLGMPQDDVMYHITGIQFEGPQVPLITRVRPELSVVSVPSFLRLAWRRVHIVNLRVK